MRVYLTEIIIASVCGAPSVAFAETQLHAPGVPTESPSIGIDERDAVIARQTNESEREKAVIVDDAARYQALEAASPEVLAFEGSGRGIYIGTGAALVVAAVVLLLVLL